MMLELDKADKNSQRLETYDAMLKTTEREAKDQITKQINKYARKGGRRYREPSESLSRTDLEVENEMLSRMVHPAKTNCWN